MEVIYERIQTDLRWFTWIAFAVALPLYAFLRQRDPLIRWHEHGNVSTKAFNALDLALVVLFFLGVRLIVLGAQALPSVTVTSNEPLSAADISSLLILTDILMKVGLASFFIYFLMVRKVDVIELFGLHRLKLSGIAIWGGVVGILAIPLVRAVGHVSTNALSQYLGNLPPQPIVEAFTVSGDWMFRAVIIAAVVIVTPVFEELFYRGYLYGVTKRYTDRFFAALFSSLVFTIAHAGVITLLPILTLSVFLILAYELSGSLWVPIVIHVLFNVANVAGMLWSSSGG